MSEGRRSVLRWASCLFICMPVHGAYANNSEYREPIAQVWVSPKPLGVIKSCIIRALDADRRTYSRISPSIKHVARVIEPDSVIDIRPVEGHYVADVDYHVRLEKIHDQITRIALYANDSGAKDQSLSDDADPKKKPAISTGRDVARAVARCCPSR
jgi:hypothetical protein